MKILKDKISGKLFFLRILIAFVQALLFVIIHDAIVRFYIRNNEFRRDISWGIALEAIFEIFFLILALLNLAIVFLRVREWWVSLVATVALFLMVFPYFDYHPYRALNVFFVGGLVIWTPLLISVVWRKYSFRK